MNKKTIITLTISSFLIGCFSFIFSFIFFKRTTLEAVILPFVLLLLAFSFSFLKEEKKKKALLFFFTAFLIVVMERGYVSFFVHKAEIKDVVTYITFGLAPFVLLLSLFVRINKHRRLFVFVSLIYTLLITKISYDYSVRYVYLYQWASDWDGYKLALLTASISSSGALLAKAIFDTKRNYLCYLLILSSAISYGVGDAIVIGSYPGIMKTINGILSSYSFYLMIYSFIIFVFMETKKEKEHEKRNIFFKDIVYQELKPIKKRKRIIAFEVPPNVPKFKNDLTLKKESEEISNEQKV